MKTIFIGLSLISTLYAQQLQSTGKITIKRADGGAAITALGYGIKVNADSSLMRAWYTIDDDSAPLIMALAGVNTRYDSPKRTYFFEPTGGVAGVGDCAAAEVRFVLFDVWGQHLKTLEWTRVHDFKANVPVPFLPASFYASEHDVSRFLTSIVFVARVRRSDGTVWNFNHKAIYDKLREINLQLAPEALVPEKLKGTEH